MQVIFANRLLVMDVIYICSVKDYCNSVTSYVVTIAKDEGGYFSIRERNRAIKMKQSLVKRVWMVV